MAPDEKHNSDRKGPYAKIVHREGGEPHARPRLRKDPHLHFPSSTSRPLYPKELVNSADRKNGGNTSRSLPTEASYLALA